MKKIFLDTSPLIYFLSDDSIFKPKMEKIFLSIAKEVEEVVLSTVTCMEYLVYPYRQNDDRAIKALENFISTKGITVFDIDMATAIKAAKIRAEFEHFKTPDAMQLATACLKGCDLFLTNDKQLKQFTEIKCVTVEEWEV